MVSVSISVRVTDRVSFRFIVRVRFRVANRLG